MKHFHKYLERFEIRCRRRIEKINCIDLVRNEKVLHRVKEQRNIIHTVKVNVKVKVTPEEATKAQKGSKGIT